MMHVDRRQFLFVVLLDAYERSVGHIAACELRRGNVDREHVVAAVEVERSFLAGFLRAVPGAVMNHDRVGADAVRNRDAGEHLAAAAFHNGHVAVSESELFSCGRMDPDGFSFLDVREEVRCRAVKLGVQAVAALRGEKRKRVLLREFGAEPFRGLEPGRVRRTVVPAGRYPDR